ncbi:MAG: hypothetical protein HY046_03415 [Acidobacteria bacterium]|nr:hypothetical protein [Acidobacteriota bacterium]
MKTKGPSSSHKKVIVVTLARDAIRGYLNPSQLGQSPTVDLLTPDGEHQEIQIDSVRSIYFVRDFTDDFEPERKAFLSRPKLDGLWVRLKFRDNDTLEGIVPNNLLDLLDRGVQITPPDLNGPSMRIFIPRTALTELTVLGVVGIQRRAQQKAAAVGQSKLFEP